MYDAIRGPLGTLKRKLGRLTDLSGEDLQRLDALLIRAELVRRFRNLIEEDETPDKCCLLVEGYACRYKETARGARQIVSFHFAGDLLDIQHLLLERADHSVQTITEATCAASAGFGPPGHRQSIVERLSR